MNKIVFIDGLMKGKVLFVSEFEEIIEIKRWYCPYFPHKPYQVTYEYELLNNINMGQIIAFYRIKEKPVEVIFHNDTYNQHSLQLASQQANVLSGFGHRTL